MAGNISFFADGLIPWTGDDIEDTSLYGKPAHATHVYLPYIEGQKLLMSKCSPSNCPLLVFTWTLWILISSFYNFFILIFSFLCWFIGMICFYNLYFVNVNFMLTAWCYKNTTTSCMNDNFYICVLYSSHICIMLLFYFKCK